MELVIMRTEVALFYGFVFFLTHWRHRTPSHSPMYRRRRELSAPTIECVLIEKLVTLLKYFDAFRLNSISLP